MSKHFCCCIPVRAGVFFFSLLSFLGAGISAGFGWYLVFREYPAFVFQIGYTHLCSFAVAVIQTHQLSRLDGEFSNDNDQQTFDTLATKYNWIFIVFSAIMTVIALMAFFG